MLFDQRDRRQETFALQAVLVEFFGGVFDVVTSTTPRANSARSRLPRIIASPMSPTKNSSSTSTRVSSANARGDFVERIRAAIERAQCRVHVLHEAMEMHAPFRLACEPSQRGGIRSLQEGSAS